MNDLKITVHHLQRGQPGPYQPHTFQSKIVVEGSRAWDRLTEDQMKHLVAGVVHPFTEEPESGSMDSHFQPRLRRLERTKCERMNEAGEWVDQEDAIPNLGPRRETWIATVSEPYCD